MKDINVEGDASSIKNKLQKIGRVMYFDKGVVLQPKEHEVLFMTKGCITVSNSISGEMIIDYLPELFPLGIIEHYQKNVDLYYRMEENTEMLQLSDKEFEGILATNCNYFIANVFSQTIADLVGSFFDRNHQSGYLTIRQLIYRYNSYNDTQSNVRERMVMYICRRTRLSRSYVFKILAELKSGGYIEIENGYLTSINRKIPTRY